MHEEPFVDPASGSVGDRTGPLLPLVRPGPGTAGARSPPAAARGSRKPLLAGRIKFAVEREKFQA
eukprot:7721332-Alexandrium_andersonii.AAC.1